MQEDIGTERSEKAALERILQKEKDLMDSAVQRQMGRAASLQVELMAAQQQRVRLNPLLIVCYSVVTGLSSSTLGVHAWPVRVSVKQCNCAILHFS